MGTFAIHPPVHLRIDPDTAIRSLDEAAAIVRVHGGQSGDSRATSVLYRLEGAMTPEQAEEAGSAFRAWARTTGLLLVVPDDTTQRG